MGSSDNYSSADSYISASQGEKIRKDPRSQFSEDELDLIVRMYKLVGDRWSLIAGRIPGRSAEEIKKYCTSPIFAASLEKEEGSGSNDYFNSAFSGDSEHCAKKLQ